jgi:methionyl-tRNA formyltransferase
MKKMSETIVFFGNERIATGVTTAAPTLQALIKANYKIAAVVTSYSENASRKTRTLEIQSIAEEHRIPVLLPDKPSDIIDELRAVQADIGVLVAYGKIVPQTIIDIFPRGIVNIHPSLLPLHRGPIPIESAVLNGEQETGVSIMQLTRAMDSGPVFAQEQLTLKGHESKQELSEKLLGIGKSLLIRSLPDILGGKLKPVAQDATKATYDRLIEKQDGVIDWTKSAEQIEREVRAFAGWPGSRTSLGNKINVTVTKAHAVPSDGKAGAIEAVNKSILIIHAGQGYLCVEKLKPAGKKEMTAREFIAGYGSRIGKEAGI